MCGEILQRVALEFRDALEVVLRHEGLEAAHEFLDNWVPVDHYAGAHLHGIRAEENELRGITSGLDTTDARKALFAAVVIPDLLRDRHHLGERDGLHGDAR